MHKKNLDKPLKLIENSTKLKQIFNESKRTKKVE